jgi:hypothetical protein
VPHSPHWLWQVSQHKELTGIAPPLDPNKELILCHGSSLSLWPQDLSESLWLSAQWWPYGIVIAYLGRATGKIALSWHFRIMLVAQVQVKINAFQLPWYDKESASLVPTAIHILEGNRKGGFAWRHLPTVELDSRWHLWGAKYCCLTVRIGQLPSSIPWRETQKWLS